MAKAKGTTLIGAVRFLRKHRQQARELLPPNLHHYLEERVAESRWYPEEDLLGLLEAVVPMIPGGRPQVLEALGAQSARGHLEGVYAHLSGGGPGEIAVRAFALWSSQHDSGRFEVTREGPGVRRMTVRDYALPSETMCGILGGYLAETLRVEGVTDIRVHKESCVLRGQTECAWRLTYRSPGPD
jgi:hypothetical protein